MGKLVKHRGWIALSADDERWFASAEFQPVLVSERGQIPDQPQDRADADQIDAFKLPLEPGPSHQLVDLPAPYALSEDDRLVLKGILHRLPPLPYPMSDDDRAAFFDAWLELDDRPLWEPILVTAADIERFRQEQKEIRMRHQQALRDEFARGLIRAVDAGHAPVTSLLAGSFIPRESAVAYLSRCGLIVEDGDAAVDTKHSDQWPGSDSGPATATMPSQRLGQRSGPAEDGKPGHRVANVRASDADSKHDLAGATGLSPLASSTEKGRCGKVARLPRVIELTGLGRSSIYNRMDSRSRYYDPTFPRCFSLSASESGAVGWDEEQVKAWVTEQARKNR